MSLTNEACEYAAHDWPTLNKDFVTFYTALPIGWRTMCTRSVNCPSVPCLHFLGMLKVRTDNFLYGYPFLDTK